MQRIGLPCLEREVGVVMADNLCEGVRALLRASVSLIVVDAALLRLTPKEHATLFERVAPIVPVVDRPPARRRRSRRGWVRGPRIQDVDPPADGRGHPRQGGRR